MKRKHVLKMSLTSLVLAAVEKLGVATISQVVALVAKHIPASQAMRKWENRTRFERSRGKKPHTDRATPQRSGKRAIVSHYLGTLAREGRIRRMQTGVYASCQSRAEAM